MVRSHRVAWTIVGLTVAINAAAMTLAVLDRAAQTLATSVMFAVVTIGFAAIGGLIASRQPGNAIGWLFMAVGVTLSVLHNLAQNYAVYTLVVAPGSLPGGQIALWLSSSALDTLFVLVMTLLLLLFPDGRTLTPRWRLAVWVAVIGGAATVANGFVAFTGSRPLEHFHNPLVVTGAALSLVTWAQRVGGVLIVAGFVAGVVSIALRFRRSTGIERQQVKWVAAGVVLETCVITLSAVLSAVGLGDLSGPAFLIAIVLFPTLMGLAILRYRLYDIDVVIRKTLVYACLVAVLAVVYLGGIAALGAVFRSATGQSSALAVTISTLAVAGAFQPLRRRIQHAIDRRFSRRTYDAETAVEAFASRMREQIDLDALGRELIDVVDDTVHPRHVTLWLRQSTGDA